MKCKALNHVGDARTISTASKLNDEALLISFSMMFTINNANFIYLSTC